MDTSSIDLLALIGRDTRLKKKSGHRGGEWKSACPRCGGSDRFFVNPNYNDGIWACRQCNIKGGDAIAYVMWMQGCDFKTAIAQLGLKDDSNYAPRQHTRRLPTPDNVPQPTQQESNCLHPEYQRKAGNFIKWCKQNLWSDIGADKLQYLKKRGLNECKIRMAQIGYNPQYFKKQWGDVEVHLLPGIIIPTINYRTWQITRIKIRLDNPRDDKYGQIAGSLNQLYTPYKIKQIADGCLVVLVESEIDALSLPPGMCVPVATCGNTGSRGVNDVMLLQSAKNVLLAFDDDEAGQSACEWWLSQLSNARVLKPTRHDVSEMLEHGDLINEWIMEELERIA